jgi:hypothetical protein
MISAVLKKDAHPNITRSASLFEGGKATHYEETIPMKLTWHSNKGWSGHLAGKNSTQRGDR